MSRPIVQLEEIRKTYRMGDVEVNALRSLSLSIGSGEYISIMGPSGCGKSTLLNVLGCLDRPTSGRYFLAGDDVAQLDDDNLSIIRGQRLGFIFQSYNLIQQLTVLENIEVPLFYQGVPDDKARATAIELVKRVGLEKRMDHRPMELSGGQQQRVAIARALSHQPRLLICDEPTSALDSATGHQIMDLLAGVARGPGRSVVIVTHDPRIYSYADRITQMEDGRVQRVVSGADVKNFHH